MMYKQVVVFRKDIKIGKGKLASHCAHASLGAMRKSKTEIVKKWEKEGAKKVVLKVDNLRRLKHIYKKAKNSRLPCFLVRDVGLTQLRKGTVTCLGIGPAEEKKIDKITGKLKLL